jgi:hypoxanthine-DNA glycosylase
VTVQPTPSLAAEPPLQGLPAVVGPRTRLVVLGSFPGAASLAAGQYYAHPRNQFWRLLSAMWGVDLTVHRYGERLQVLQDRGLGLWDVYARCRRQGSLDSAIRDAEPNPLGELARWAPQLAAVAHNGGESARLSGHTAALGVPVHRLPSTSPANASWSFERKLKAWRTVFQSCGV